MNHKWVKNKDFKPSDWAYAEYECSTCGCKKQKNNLRQKGKNYFVDYFMRSGVVFTDRMPECLDWNDNTLD